MRDRVAIALTRFGGRLGEGASYREMVGHMSRAEFDDEGVVLAIDVSAVLPKLKDASTIGALAEERPRGRNCFIFIRGTKFRAPNDLPVPVEQVTAIFEGAWRPQSEIPRPGTSASWFTTK
jgi:hypothetical protein